MTDDKLKNYAIILASGLGSRFGNNIPKQFEKINGKTILERSIEIFENNEGINEIILVITPQYHDMALSILGDKYKKLSKILKGGSTRKESSSIGMNSILDKEANVLIHDCARPFLSQEVLNNCINSLNIYDAVNVAIPVTDTIMEIENGMVKNIPDRKNLIASQTPQCFKLSVIKKAHYLAENENSFTDDCGLVLKYKLADIYIVEGNRENIKITYPQDMFIAKIFDSKR